LLARLKHDFKDSQRRLSEHLHQMAETILRRHGIEAQRPESSARGDMCNGAKETVAAAAVNFGMGKEPSWLPGSLVTLHVPRLCPNHLVSHHLPDWSRQLRMNKRDGWKVNSGKFGE
jgi:hypothetical protein